MPVSFKEDAKYGPKIASVKKIFIFIYTQNDHKNKKNMKEHEFVTLAKFTSVNRAAVVKALLDSVGIDNQIINDTAVSMMPMLGNGIQIIVNAEDYDRAKEVMEAKFDKTEFAFESKKK